MIALNDLFCTRIYSFIFFLLFLHTLHIRVRTHSCLCFTAQQVSLFLPLFPYCSTGIPYSPQSQMWHSILLSSAGGLDWGWKTAAGAGCTTEGGSLGRCVLICTCQGRVDAWSCPIHSDRSKCSTAPEKEESTPKVFRGCITGIKCQS